MSARWRTLAVRNAAAMARNYADAGFTCVLDGAVVGRAHVMACARAVYPHRLHLVVLAPPVQVSEERDARRSGKTVAAFFRHLRPLLHEQLAELGLWLDTSQQTPAESVTTILSLRDKAMLDLRETPTKEHDMATNARPANHILGSLGAADGKGVVRIEDRYDTDIEDLWSAIADPARIARWYGRVDGDLRPGGEFRLYVDDAESDHVGRVEECEPPRRLRVTTRETDESYQRGKGVPPYDEVLEAALTADGDQTILVIEIRGMPLEAIAFYGAGWQIHAENLAGYLAGRERGGNEARWGELVPSYQDLAASIG